MYIYKDNNPVFQERETTDEKNYTWGLVGCLNSELLNNVSQQHDGFENITIVHEDDNGKKATIIPGDKYSDWKCENRIISNENEKSEPGTEKEKKTKKKSLISTFSLVVCFLFFYSIMTRYKTRHMYIKEKLIWLYC